MPSDLEVQALSDRLSKLMLEFDRLKASEYVARSGAVASRDCDFPEALLIAHFDGPEPANTDFSGNPNGHRGQRASFAGTGVIWRPGKFGKAVQVANATTNLVLNPSGETNTSNTNQVNCTLTRTQTGPVFGSYEFTIAYSGVADEPCRWTTGAVTSGTVYTWSLYIRSDTACTIRVYLYDGTSSFANSDLVIPADGEWHRYSSSGAATASATGYIYVRGMANTSASVRVDGIQVEAKSAKTPYCDGSLGSGHVWAGTAHGSTSTRAAASISYASPITRSGTVAAWVSREWGAETTAHRVYDDMASFILFAANDGLFHANAGNAGISGGNTADYDDGEWVHLCQTWDLDAGTHVLYVNGVQVASGAPGGVAPGSTLYVGNRSVGDRGLDGLVDDLVILPRVLSATEVKALCDCTLPVSPGAVSTCDGWQPAVRYSSNAGQVVHTATLTVLNYEDAVYDNCGWVQTGTSWRFTAHTPGVYRVTARMCWNEYAWGAGQQLYLSLYKNGASFSTKLIEIEANGTMFKTIDVADDVELAIGDYLDVRVYHTHGADMAVYNSSAYNSVSIHRIPS